MRTQIEFRELQQMSQQKPSYRLRFLNAALLAIFWGALATQAVFAGQNEALETALENASYLGIEEQPITLKEGHWQGEPYVEGGASRPTAGLIPDFHFNADLDNDGQAEIISFLWQSSGGSGTNIYLAVMRNQGEGVENIATALIGDRVKLINGRFESGQILIDVLQAGEDDAMCCPSQLATRSWTMESGKLKEGAFEVTGKLALTVLKDTNWVLTQMNQTVPPSEGFGITLAFVEDRIAGKSACNRYSAGINDGENPGDVIIGPAMGTRMACAKEIMQIESEYLATLTGVNSFSFLSGQLLLTGRQTDGSLVQLRYKKAEQDQ